MRRATKDEIMYAVSDVLGVQVEKILCKVRKKQYVDARRIFSYIAHLEGHSYPSIATALNRPSHATPYLHTKTLKAYQTPAERKAIKAIQQKLDPVRCDDVAGMDGFGTMIDNLGKYYYLVTRNYDFQRNFKNL